MEQYLGIPTVYPKSRKEWRKWLEKNYAKATNVWLIMYKKSAGKPGIFYAEAVEEALCFGWIDSKPNKRDEESFYQSFAKRKPKSMWSKINKGRIDKLISEGLMTDAGMAAIETAKQNGSWNTLNVIDNLVMPDDLVKAFNKNKKAKKNFDAFSISAQKIILYWIYSAKRPETRLSRIQETVEQAAKNVRANQYNP